MQTPANLSFESVCRSIMVATSFHINLLCHCFPTQQILAQVLSKRCFLISLRSSVVRQALDKFCPKHFFPVSISHFVSVFVFYFSVLFKDMLFAVFLFAWKEVPVCPRNWLTSRSPICARSIWVQPRRSEHLEILDVQLPLNLNHLKSASALLLSGMQGQVGATKGGLGAICNYANYSASHSSKVSSLKMSNFSHQAFWMKLEKLQLFCESQNHNAFTVNMNCVRVLPGPCHLYKIRTWVSQSDSLAELSKLFPSLTLWKPSPPPPSPSDSDYKSRLTGGPCSTLPVTLTSPARH